MKKKIIVALLLLFLIFGLIFLVKKQFFSTGAINANYKSFEITKGGEYSFDSSFKGKAILVNTDKTVKLKLNSVKMKNKKGPCIAIISKGKTEIELTGNNELVSGKKFDNMELEGVIFSMGDLTFSGDGNLKIVTEFEDGIHSKANLVISGGNFDITAPKDGIKAVDSVVVDNGNITINAGEDGIKAYSQRSDTLGYLEINGGTFNIEAGSKAIRSITKLTINGGKFTLNAGEGIESTYVIINDGDIDISASDDGINGSIKSNFMTPLIEVNGGNIKIVTTMNNADAFDSNGNLHINGGNINITAKSPFDYDNEGIYNGGTVIVNGEQVTYLQNEFDGKLKSTNTRTRR